MAVNLSSLQESYIRGLRQMTEAGDQTKKLAATPSERQGLGSKAKKQQSGKEYAYYSRSEQLRTALNISNKALLLSFIFWVFLLYSIYVLGGYILVGLRIMWSDADLEGECQHHFSKDPEENLQAVMNYPKGDAGPYIARFTADRSDYKDYPADSKALPPLVLGAMSSQFFLLQGFLRHVQQDLLADHRDIKLIVYDVGLYLREREILKQYCGCEVRTLEYQLFPDHVADPWNFAWRPIIIQTVLEEFGAAMYVDPTTRFKTSNSLNMVRSRGHNHFLLWETVPFTSTTGYTNRHTFTYLNESRCLFSDVGVIDSQVMVVYKTSVTWHNVMKPWLKCVLNLECLAPRWSHWDGCLHFRRPKTTGCHRFDLSALSITLNRGLQMTVAGHKNHYNPPRFFYTSEDEPLLFPQQPWTTNQLLILFAAPWLFLIIVFRKLVLKCLNGTILKDT